MSADFLCLDRPTRAFAIDRVTMDASSCAGRAGGQCDRRRYIRPRPSPCATTPPPSRSPFPIRRSRRVAAECS